MIQQSAAKPLKVEDVVSFLETNGLAHVAQAVRQQLPTAAANEAAKGSLASPMETPASPTPAKPMEPSTLRIPPLDMSTPHPLAASRFVTSPHRSPPADEGFPMAELELWDPREPGVVTVPGTEEDIWRLDPDSNLAPRFVHGGGLTVAQYSYLLKQPPELVPTQPYQKRPPPNDLPLESFDLRVIYEAGRTGFEDQKDFPISVGSVIAGRYQISEYLGSAAFSRAVQCIDLKHNAPVCVKIIRNSKDFFDQSLDEVKLLLHLNSNGDPDTHNILQMYDYFYYKEHMFLVCELLRDNLYEFSKFNREHESEPYFTLERVRLIAKQILEALAFVHSLNLLHCDLKPENILIKSYSRCIIKVIDFGSSCYRTDSLSSYVQSRCYRAPEVILGCPYDGRIDIWSLGAILPELMTGHVLFYNESLPQMLARIAAICGPFPESMLHSGRHTSCFVTAHGAIYEYPSKEGATETSNAAADVLFHFPRPTKLEHLAGSQDPDYLDFVRKALTLDPSQRPTAAELLRHPFIVAGTRDASNSATSTSARNPSLS